MFAYPWKMLKVICLSGLVFCLLALCVGVGCLKATLGKRSGPAKPWTCDKQADDALKGHNYETSILLHQGFLEKEPENALALYHLGYAFGETEEDLKEVFYYNKAIALGFEANGIFFNLGMAYGELNESEKSVAAFKKALEINPDSADNHYGLAMAYYQSGLADKLAEEEFLKAIKIDPGHVDARLYLSILYADIGELQRAEDQLRKILEIDSTHRSARELLERIEHE